jgi:benzoyl-CoA reductase/2-hydroxyglutaryl-CoA dehydratase subunit BcrC/BadD/HgdB
MAAGSFYQNGCEDAIDLYRSQGFADHYCTVHAAYPGYVMNGNWRVPDVMVKPAAPCVSGNAGYQVVSRKYGVPLVIYDASYYLNEDGVDYQTNALKRAIPKLAKISGRALDVDLLRAKIEESNRTYALLGELHELRKHKPNPDPGLHRVLDVLVLVTLLGEPECTEYFQLIVDEARTRVENGTRIIPDDKQEIRAVHTWAVNVYLPEVYHWLEETFGMTYLTCGLSYFINHQIDTSSLDSMLRGWVQRTMNFPMGRQSISYGDVWADDMVDLAVEMEADCGIFAGNVACKQAWAISKLMCDRLEDEFDIPALRFEIECCDKRLCPADEFKERVESFVEVRL